MVIRVKEIKPDEARNTCFWPLTRKIIADEKNNFFVSRDKHVFPALKVSYRGINEGHEKKEGETRPRATPSPTPQRRLASGSKAFANSLR